jgi:hypothetical protein
LLHNSICILSKNRQSDDPPIFKANDGNILEFYQKDMGHDQA